MEWARQLQQGWDALIAFYLMVYQADQSLFALLLALTVLFIGVPLVLLLRMFMRRLRRNSYAKTMGTREMRKTVCKKIDEEIRQKASEIITDVVDQFYLDNDITNKDRRIIWMRYAKSFGMWDLVPKDPIEKTPDPYSLKERIRSRLGFKKGEKVRLRFNKPQVNETAFEEELKKALSL